MKTESSVQVKFLKKTKDNLYEFSSEREATHPLEDIQKQMSQPVMIAVGRALAYKFPNAELQELSEDFFLR